MSLSSLHTVVCRGSPLLGRAPNCPGATSRCPPAKQPPPSHPQSQRAPPLPARAPRGGPVFPGLACSAWPGKSSQPSFTRWPKGPDLAHCGPQDSVCANPMFSGKCWGVSLVSLCSGSSAVPGLPALALQPHVRDDGAFLPLCPAGTAAVLGALLKSRSPLVLLRGAQARSF